MLHRRAVLKLALDGAPIDASSERDYAALLRTFEQMQKEGTAPTNVKLLGQQVAPDAWRLVLASIFDLIASPE